jgi:hypothetical protein
MEQSRANLGSAHTLGDTAGGSNLAHNGCLTRLPEFVVHLRDLVVGERLLPYPPRTRITTGIGYFVGSSCQSR